MTTNFDPHECVTLLQSMKIGTHENKAIHGIYCMFAYGIKYILIKGEI